MKRTTNTTNSEDTHTVKCEQEEIRGNGVSTCRRRRLLYHQGFFCFARFFSFDHSLRFNRFSIKRIKWKMIRTRGFYKVTVMETVCDDTCFSFFLRRNSLLQLLSLSDFRLFGSRKLFALFKFQDRKGSVQNAAHQHHLVSLSL